MADQERTFHQQSTEGARNRLPLITLVKNGNYKVRPVDEEEDPTTLGDKFSAIPIHKCWTRRYFVGPPTNSELVCGAESETGFQGMKPSFANPQAQACGRCPRGSKGDKSCKAGLRLVIARINKDDGDDLHIVRLPGSVVAQWLDLERAYEKEAHPLIGHRIGFKSEEKEGIPHPVTKLVVGKPMTNAEYDAYVRLFDEARKTNAPRDDEEQDEGRTFNQASSQGEQERDLQRTTDELGKQRRDRKHEQSLAAQADADQAAHAKSIEDEANEDDPTNEDDIPW